MTAVKVLENDFFFLFFYFFFFIYFDIENIYEPPHGKTICICENKGADQLLAVICGCTA